MGSEESQWTFVYRKLVSRSRFSMDLYSDADRTQLDLIYTTALLVQDVIVSTAKAGDGTYANMI